MSKSFKTSKEHITFIPLGGSGHFGANFNLYGYDQTWIGLDCGMGFAGDRYPGIDLLLPNPSFIEDHNDDLKAIIITHAHEDHIGGVTYLWPKLKCPIYTSHFTAEVLRRKLSETDYGDDVEIIEVESYTPFRIGPYEMTFIPVSHSIPDTHAVYIETEIGGILHSGDWNIDPKPMAGLATREEDFIKLRDRNVLSFVGDSTNAPFDKPVISESDLVPEFERVVAGIEGRVIVTLFSSNIGRIKTVAMAAKENGRHVCLIGRSLKNMASIAKLCGYLDGVDNFLSEEEAGYLDANRIVYIVTGSQGEYRAALPKMSRGANRDVKLDEGDVVLFSARAIPGNERAIADMKNLLAAQGVKFIMPNEEKIHVSGHPYMNEVKQMFDWVKPKSVVAVHGERENQEALVELAHKSQIHSAVVPENGSVIEISETGAKIVDHVETDFLLYDEGKLIPEDHISVHERRKMGYNGAAFVTVEIDNADKDISDIQFTCFGLLDESLKADQKVVDDLLDKIDHCVSRLPRDKIKSDDIVHETVRLCVRRFFKERYYRKPLIEIHIVRT